MDTKSLLKKSALCAACAVLVLGTGTTFTSCVDPPDRPLISKSDYASVQNFRTHLERADAGDAYSQARVALCYFTGDGTLRNGNLAWTYVNRSVNRRNHWGYGAAAAMILDDGDRSTAEKGFRKAEDMAREVGDYNMAEYYHQKYKAL